MQKVYYPTWVGSKIHSGHNRYTSDCINEDEMNLVEKVGDFITKSQFLKAPTNC